MVSASVFDHLYLVQTVRIPQTNHPVLTNRNDLLLFIIEEYIHDLFVFMCHNAVDDAKRVRVDHDKTSFCATCCHETERWCDIESDDVGMLLIATIFVAVCPETVQTKSVEDLDWASKWRAD